MLALLLTLSGVSRKNVAVSLILSLATFLYFSLSYNTPLLTSQGVSGTALIRLSSISPTSTPFSKGWLYRGKISAFYENGSGDLVVKNGTFSLVMPKSHRPKGNALYQVKGQLFSMGGGHYVLKVNKNEIWTPLQTVFLPLPELRYEGKGWVKRYIDSVIPTTRSAAFLKGIATGEFEDHLMVMELGRFGLQHIMAISGFHFSIVALLFSTLFGGFLKKKWASMIVICLLSGYFLFLGCSPSILRAWIMILISLLSTFFNKKHSALNGLGIAVLAVIFIDPHMCHSLGFKYSFLVTASILLFYGPIESILSLVLQKRPLGVMLKLNPVEQYGYLILTLTKQCLALTAAVHVTALPLTLFFFHKFPILSLLYNFFYPFLVSISIFLLIISSLTHAVIPPLGAAMHSFNSWFTDTSLSLVYNMPPSLDFTLRGEISLEPLLLYLFLLIPIAMVASRYHRQRHEWTFL